MNNLLIDVNSILNYLQPITSNELPLKRLGSKNDGGYVIANDLFHDDFLISFGIGNDVNFEIEIVEVIAGAQLYDDSISNLPTLVPKSVFFSERIDTESGVSLTDALSRIVDFKDLILKIDIEGSEWNVLDEASGPELSKFRQIIVEFHWLSEIMNEDFRKKVLRVLKKISETHIVINSHPNNWSDVLVIENLQIPNVVEVTFLRREKSLWSSSICQVLAKSDLLNAPCNPDRPEIYLHSSIDSSLLNVNSKAVGIFSKTICDDLTQQRDDLTQQRDDLTQQRDALLNSTIWKISWPLRYVFNFIKR